MLHVHRPPLGPPYPYRRKPLQTLLKSADGSRAYDRIASFLASRVGGSPTTAAAPAFVDESSDALLPSGKLLRIASLLPDPASPQLCTEPPLFLGALPLPFTKQDLRDMLCHPAVLAPLHEVLAVCEECFP